MTLIYFAATQNWAKYETLLPAALARAGIAAQIVTEMPSDPSLVDFIIYAPSAALQDFTPFTQCRAVLSLWAGVERIVTNATLTQPLCRMVDAGLTEGMVEWVTGHVLRHHLGMDRHICNPERIWDPKIPPLARDRVVAMLGMGALGTACAGALASLNFQVLGWSRSAKKFDGITSYTGMDGLQTILSQADFIVTLLPKTPATENILDDQSLAWAKPGAVILNPGRGPLIDDRALIAALDKGHIAAATLDVFRLEPLPQDHAFWSHPKITITPHIAADTRAEGAVTQLVENIHRSLVNAPLLHMVDRSLGY